MHIKKRYLLLSALVLILGAYLFIKLNAKWTEEKETKQFNLSLQQLRAVTKLVIWEQDFILTDIETKEKIYKYWFFDSKESVSTTIQGKMGFHIDLSDSANTAITRTKDSVFIKAPLLITYVSLDLGTMQQIKESSLDPTLEVDKEEVIKHLDQKALEQYLPQIQEALRTKDLKEQERKLSGLVGKPVRITITRMPVASDWKK